MATRWACIGAGKIANDFFTAVRDNLPKEEHEVNAEVVYVATINFNHAELCIKMMNAGKHVLCEKPMALNLKQTKQVLQAAKRNNVLFVEGLWNRFFPVFTQARKELAEKTVGTVKLIRAQFHARLPDEERFRTLELGGGGCIVFGSYLISLACLVYDEMPESINAVGNLMPTGVDESGCIILKYKNGAMASLMYHGDLPFGNSAVIYGDNGEIKLEGSLRCPTTVTTPSGTYDFPIKGGDRREDYNFSGTSGFQYEASAIRNCIKTGDKEATEAPHRYSIMISTILDEVRKQLGVVYPCD